MVLGRISSGPLAESATRKLPIHHGAIVRVVGFAVAPVVVEFVGEGVFVELDAEARGGRDVDVAVAHLEGLLKVADAEGALFLAEEIGNGGGKVQARCE